jgi:hypothetical protein
MTFDPATGGRHREPAAASGNWMADHRARIALEESERLERKQQELLEQTSERNTPAERIRIWERRHRLTLPRDSNHRILAVVAHQTDLALEQVREEQQRRLARINGEAVVVPTADSSRVT